MGYRYENRVGFVYFIQESVLKNIKIGFTSSSPKRRLKDLALGNSQELYFLGFMIADKPHENYLHKKFAHLHIQQEWFKPGEDLLLYIEKLDYRDEFSKELSKYVKAP